MADATKPISEKEAHKLAVSLLSGAWKGGRNYFVVVIDEKKRIQTVQNSNSTFLKDVINLIEKYIVPNAMAHELIEETKPKPPQQGPTSA